MTDKKDDKTNILIGPWGDKPVENNGEWIKEKYNKALDKNNTSNKVQEKLDRIEIITEKMMVQLIHTMSEYGYNISDERFILDIGFLSETIKGIISRQEKVPHIVQGLLDNIMSPEPTKNEDGMDVYYSRFDAPLLEELVDMADEVKDGTEITFEPDTELGDITNWNKDEEKGSLHNMRSKKIHDKKKDEEKDDE
tara:strand:+ start:412 stop:996 length:585 start_codon:yes stop_codon:yes gene_type:complete